MFVNDRVDSKEIGLIFWRSKAYTLILHVCGYWCLNSVGHINPSKAAIPGSNIFSSGGIVGIIGIIVDIDIIGVGIVGIDVSIIIIDIGIVGIIVGILGIGIVGIIGIIDIIIDIGIVGIVGGIIIGIVGAGIVGIIVDFGIIGDHQWH